MKKSIRPWLSGTLMVSMVLGSAQLQASAAGVGVFKDLNASHNWGLKAIAKMAATGVIVGEPNGNFLPDNSVTQEQAITMVVNELGLKSEVQAYKAADYKLSYKSVSNWAKPYIAIADKHHLLRAEEANHFSGTHAASREWVAQLLVRMIGKEGELSKYAKTSTQFTDKSKISSWASSYVNLAASGDYGLINGSPNKDGSFSFYPTTAIKRIELACLLDKSEKFLPALPSAEIQGQVTSIQGGVLTIRTDANEEKFYLDSKTYIFDKGKKATTAAIQPSQQVVVVGTPTASYVEILDPVTLQEKVTGTVLKVYKDKNTFVLKDTNGTLQSYKVDDQVIYRTKQGSIITIDDIAENDTVELALVGGNVTAVYKMNEQAQVNGNVTIYDVDLKNSLLTVQVGSDIHPYVLPNTVTVTYPDNRQDGVNGLRKGMTIDLDLTGEKINSIKVNTIIEEGTIKAVAPEDSIVTYETSDGHLRAYKLENTASIQIQGTPAALSDVQIGDKVGVEINANGIDSLNVTDRTAPVVSQTVNNNIEGTIVGIDTSSTPKTLFLKLKDSGEIKSYEFGSSFDMFIDGNLQTDLSLLNKDMLAKIQLSNGDISYLSVDNRLDGKVVQVDSTKKTLTIALPDGEQKAYVVDNNCVVNVAHLSSANLSSLSANDAIHFKVVNGQITQIDVQKVFQYKVINVNQSNNEIVVVDDQSNTSSLYIKNSVDFTVLGFVNPNVQNVNQNDLVTATYVGNELKTVEVKPATTAAVTNAVTQ